MRGLALLSLLGAIAWAPAATAGEAAAPPDTYALIAIDIAGDAAPELKNAIAQSVVRGLAQAGSGHVGFDVVEQALRAKPELVGCTTTTCLARLGAVVGADRFLTAHVETAGAAYKIELTALTADGPVARAQGACEVCTLEELSELITKKTAELVSARPSQPVAVTLATSPGGGHVAVSRPGAQGALRPVGKSPASVSLPPGTYLVEVRLAGYSVLRKSITVSDSGEPQSFDLTLSQQAEHHGHRPFRMWKWVTGGVAVAALVAGAIELGYDGNGTCGTPPCPKVYDTTAAGIGFLAVGVVAGGAGGWMFWRDHKDAHHVRGALALTPHGASAALSIDW
jgi:PEGA domain